MEKDQKFGKEMFVYNLEAPLLDLYEVNYEMGRGAFSKIYEVRNKKTGEIRACKYTSKKEFKAFEIEKFRKEIEILQKSDHPNIIKLYEVLETPNSFYLIMEKCNGGNLFYKIEQRMKTKKLFDEKILSEVIRQIASAIQYLHDIGICHRDIKPENICFLNLGEMENNIVKIIDFGLGKILDIADINNKLKSLVGSVIYMAPEVLQNQYNEKCDIWSLGVILYFFIAGHPPFFGQNDSETKYKILSMKYDKLEGEKWSNVSEEIKDLINHILVKEEDRYSAQDILNHKWIKKQKIFPINSEDRIKQFKIYQKMDNFEKKIIMFIATRLNENEIKNIKNFFDAFDNNNDGRISFEEFYDGVLKISKNIKKEEIEKMFQTIDTNEDGRIEYTEFIAACINENLYLEKKRLLEIYQAIDKKLTGRISKDNIKSALQLDKECYQKFEDLMNELYKDNDGTIDFEQFIKMISLIISNTLNKKN